MRKNEDKKPTVFSLIIPAALIALGVFRLTTPLSTFWLVVYIGIVVLASLDLLIKVGVMYFGRTTDEAARDIHALNKKVYSGPHEFRDVKVEDFPKLDQGFFRAATQELEHLGFRELGDVIDASIQDNWSEAVIRLFLDSTGTVSGCIYDLRLKRLPRVLQMFGLIQKDFRTVEFETELCDGRFIETGNTGDVPLNDFAGMSRRRLARNIPIPELLKVHHRHVAEVLGSHADVTVVHHTTKQDVLAAANRVHMLKSAQVQSGAIDPADELARIQGKPLDESGVKLAEKLRTLQQRDRTEREMDRNMAGPVEDLEDRSTHS